MAAKVGLRECMRFAASPHGSLVFTPCSDRFRRYGIFDRSTNRLDLYEEYGEKLATFNVKEGTGVHKVRSSDWCTQRDCHVISFDTFFL